MPAVEGDFGNASLAVRPEASLRVEFARERQQRAFHRIASHSPAVVLPVQDGLVAQGGSMRQLSERWVGCNRYGVDLDHHHAFGCVACALDDVELAWRDDGGCNHLFAGQSTRFIRANYGDRAERLDCRQPADDGIASGHRLHSDRERDGKRRRKAFGNGGDRQADNSHEGFHKGQMRDRSTEGQQEPSEE